MENKVTPALNKATLAARKILQVRSNLGKFYAYDLEIDRTYHRLIISPRSSEVANSSHHNSAFTFDSTVLKYDNANFDYDPANFDFDLSVCISKFSLDNMANNYKTLKELATLDIMCQPLSQPYELKSRLIYLLPKFYCLASEDPRKHLEIHGNTQQFGVRGFVASRVVNEVVVANNKILKNKINELTSLVRQHHNSPPMRVCGICASIEHPIDACPTLQETKQNSTEFQQNVTATIQDLQTYIGHLATIVNQVQSTGYGHIPSQNILSPQENMSHPIITANKLQVEQKERLLQDLKKLRDFYEHFAKERLLFNFEVLVKEATRGCGIGFVKMNKAPPSKDFGCKILHIFSTFRVSKLESQTKSSQLRSNSSQPDEVFPTRRSDSTCRLCIRMPPPTLVRRLQILKTSRLSRFIPALRPTRPNEFEHVGGVACSSVSQAKYTQPFIRIHTPSYTPTFLFHSSMFARCFKWRLADRVDGFHNIITVPHCSQVEGEVGVATWAATRIGEDPFLYLDKKRGWRDHCRKSGSIDPLGSHDRGTCKASLRIFLRLRLGIPA
ncbi:hypothetical protein CR513_06531, partial [Mucuna pruriens]